ncbi:PTC6 [Pyruvate dehydrogenase [acetyl-transferring]]-phosphatase 2 [Candida maltosa Xu316]
MSKTIPHHLHRFFQPNRHLSTTVTFTALDYTSKIPSKVGKLKVRILDSPSHFGHFTSRVNRLYNEDKYSASLLTFNGSNYFNFSVFDGHGGDQCSKYLAENLAQNIEDSDELVKKKTLKDKLFKLYKDNLGSYWKRWYRHREDHVQEWTASKLTLKNYPSDDLTMRLPLSFLDTDYKHEKSGSTATSVFVQPMEGMKFFEEGVNILTVAHVGDTRAILVDREGLAHTLTSDHHPSNPIETRRLRKYGANFFMKDSFGEERVLALANTRAFGDIDYKDLGITAEPDISQYVIGDKAAVRSNLTSEEIAKHTVGGLGGDEAFIVLCSDGVTNVLTDQEIVDIVMVNVSNKGHAATPQKCAEEVIKFVEYVGGDDNATCLVIRLSGWGKWPTIDRTGELRQARLTDFNPRGGRG